MAKRRRRVQRRHGGVVVQCVRLNGAPLDERATVSLRVGHGRTRSATTDETGIARFVRVPPGVHEGYVSCPRMRAESFEADVRRGEVEQCVVFLDEGITVAGRVTRSEDGRPIAGARVVEDASVRRRDAQPDAHAATTDAGGRFTLGGVDRGPDAVGRLVVTAPGRAGALVNIDVDAGPVEIQVTLAPGGTLRGVVTRPAARRRSRVPISVRQVRSDRSPQRPPARKGRRGEFLAIAETDLDGRWTMENVPLGVPLVVKSGVRGGRRALVVIDPVTRVADVRIPVFRQERFDVLVLDPDGAPLRGAEVSAVGTRLRVRTGRNGRATLRAGDREVSELTASHPIGWPTSVDLRYDLAPREPVQIQLRRRAWVSGYVVALLRQRDVTCELVFVQRELDGRDVATGCIHVTPDDPSFRIELSEGPAEVRVSCTDGRRASLAFTAPVEDLVVRLPRRRARPN